MALLKQSITKDKRKKIHQNVLQPISFPQSPYMVKVGDAVAIRIYHFSNQMPVLMSTVTTIVPTLVQVEVAFCQDTSIVSNFFVTDTSISSKYFLCATNYGMHLELRI